jgi:predicted nucleic acid-binding Zn ribbon protein
MTYTYICRECGNVFDYTADFFTLWAAICPECKSKYVSRKYAPITTIYKAKDFYTTDKKK